MKLFVRMETRKSYFPPRYESLGKGAFSMCVSPGKHRASGTRAAVKIKEWTELNEYNDDSFAPISKIFWGNAQKFAVFPKISTNFDIFNILVKIR